MSLYNLLFGMNRDAPLLLAVIGLREHDVERFRDVSASSDGTTIKVYTRTGGGNREDYPNLAMRQRPEWRGSVDDEYDSTYCTDTFAVPAAWVDDTANLDDILTHGMRPEFGAHLATTLRREPTDAEKAKAAYEREGNELRCTEHVMANGHTFVPYTDAAMEVALKLAEANDGKLRSCWGILPLSLSITTNERPWPGARDEAMRSTINRVKIDYHWTIDQSYWRHCQERFTGKFPKAMALVAESVAQIEASKR